MLQLVLLALFISAGCAAGRLGLAKKEDYKPLTNIVFYICLPASLLVSFQEADFSSGLYMSIIILSVSIIASLIAGLLIARALSLEKETLYALLISGFFGNIVFLGFPFVELMLGSASLAIAGVFVAVYNVFIFLFVFPVLSVMGGKAGSKGPAAGLWKVASNPVIWFTVIGVITLALGISLVQAMPYLKAFASLTTPLSLMAVGLFLSGKFALTSNRGLVSISAVKCLVFPGITLALLLASGLLGTLEGKTMLLLSLMPVAISNFIISDSLGLKREELVMESIIVTSIISAVIVAALAVIGIL
jgi:predicted permease